MALWGAFSSVLGWDRCSGSPARWYKELPIRENRNVSRTKTEAFSLIPWLYEKGYHLWHNRMNICGLQHFASVWKDILVSFRGVTTKPLFCMYMGGIFSEWNWDKIMHKTHKNTQSQSNTIVHTQYTQRGPCMRKWVVFPLQSWTQNQTGLRSRSSRLFS